MPGTEDVAVARRLWEDSKAAAKGVAELRGHGHDQKKLTPEELTNQWNTEADGWTPEKELALLADGKSREEVGRLKYPNREKMTANGPRALSKKEQFAYAAEMAKKADPLWAPLPVVPKEPHLAEPEPLPQNLVVEPVAPPVNASELLRGPARPTDPMLPLGG